MTDILTLREAADGYHLSERTLRKFLRSGELARYQLAPKGRILLRRSELERWLESKRRVVEKDIDAVKALEALLA